MASSIRRPAVRLVSALTIPDMETTAAWVVPAPSEMIMLPVGVFIGKSIPIAAAKGCGTRLTSRAPAPNPASCTALRSTLVTP